MKILILNKDDMINSINMKEVIEADKEALSIYSSKKANIPLRTNIDVSENEGQALFMPGYASESKGLGIKIVSVYPNNINIGKNSVPSSMILLDEKTGEVKCFIPT